VPRVLFRGGRVFDGSGAPLRDADIVVEDGLIQDVGLGLDGDTVIDVARQAVLPGLFDCHVHVAISHVDAWRLAQTAVLVALGYVAEPHMLCGRPGTACLPRDRRLQGEDDDRSE
jgi:adenine deaminase